MPFLVKIGFEKKDIDLKKSDSKKIILGGKTSCNEVREEAARREAEEATGFRLNICKDL